MWMASSLALAGCGEAVEPEASMPAEPFASESQRLETPGEEGPEEQRRIIVYQTTSLQVVAVDESGTETVLAQRAGPLEYSPDGGRVAFAKLPDSWDPGEPVVSAELYVANLRSGRVAQVTRGYDDTEPLWTPDGQSLLFQSSRRSGVASLWKVRGSGVALDQVTNEGGTRGGSEYVPNPASSNTVQWAPTERRIIVYSTTSLTNGDVRVIDFNRALDVRATYSLGEGHSPRWTEQGTVVFARNEGEKVIYIEVSVD